MRVLMLNHNIAAEGGTYFRALNFGRHLVARGYDVTLVAISQRSRFRFREYSQDGVTIVESPDLLWGRGRSGWDPWDALARTAFLHRRRFDLIHAFDCRPVVILPALRLRGKTGARLVVDWADWWGRGGTQADRPGRSKMLYAGVETFFEEHFRTRADLTTAISQLLRDRAVSLGVKPRTVTVLPGGCDIDRITFQPDGRVRDRLGLGKAQFVVGYMGAAALADAELLLNALRLLRESVADARLLAIRPKIAGSSRSFEALVPSDLKEAIVTTSYVPMSELASHLSICDVLALPLRSTLANRARWPSRIGDYLASGRPIVATRVSDAQNLFVHEIGLLTDDNPEDFAKGLLAIAQNPERSKIFGNNARRLAEGEMSWETLTTRLDGIYRSILAESPPRQQEVILG